MVGVTKAVEEEKNVDGLVGGRWGGSDGEVEGGWKVGERRWTGHCLLNGQWGILGKVNRADSKQALAKRCQGRVAKLGIRRSQQQWVEADCYLGTG